MLEVFRNVKVLPVPNNYVLVGAQDPVDGRRVTRLAARKGIHLSR